MKNTTRRTKPQTATRPDKASQNGHQPLVNASADDGFDEVFLPKNIPVKLRGVERWVVYKLVPRNDGSGKYDKIPYDPKTGQRASTTDPRTWGTFAQACTALVDFDGIGFVFTAADDYVGLDLDDCRVKGVILLWAQAFIDDCASYSEISVSGAGVHVIGTGALPAAVNKRDYMGGKVEMYADGRFFAMTGQRLQGLPTTVSDIAAPLARIHAVVWADGDGDGDTVDGSAPAPARDTTGRYPEPDFGPTGMADAAVLQRCRNDADADKFIAIFDHGDLSDVDGNDDSNADYYVWGKLAFYLGNDIGRIAVLSGQGAHFLHPEDPAKARARQAKWARRDPAYGTFAKHQIAKLLSTRTRADVFGGGTTVTGSGSASQAVKARPLPALMADAAYYGPLGQIARGIEDYIEADSGALLVNLLVTAGIAMGRGPYVQTGAQRQHAVLYAATTGETGGNKSDGTNAPIDIVETASAINHSDYSPDPVDMPRINGLSTGEVLLWLMRDEIRKPVTDKKTHVTTNEIVDFGVADKRLLAIEPEFARILTVMGRDGNTLSTTIRTLYDSPAKAQSASKASPCTATEPHFGMIGQITPAELKHRMSDVELVNGFTNRILWTYTRRVKSLPDPPDYSQVVHDHARLWIQAIERAVKIGRVTRDADATAQWKDGGVYDQLRDGTRPGLPPREGMAKDVCSRAHTAVIRLSLIFAALDGSSVITTEHQNAALAIWDFCERCANYLFADLATDPMANVILSALKAGRMKREQITALFSRHEKASAIEYTLGQLVAAGQVRSYQEPTSGRPTTWWEYVAPTGDDEGTIIL